MRGLLALLLALRLVAGSAFTAPRDLFTRQSPQGCKQIQHKFGDGFEQPDSRAERIKQAYLDSWNQYAEYAFGYDEILPLTNRPNHDYYSWGLTIVDGIDTALVMGLSDVVERQLVFIENVDFSKSHEVPDVFDTTIRYIGGLLSAYDLITENKVPNATQYNTTQVAALLNGARTLADLLKPCFDTPSGLPHFFINTTTHETSDGPYPYTNPLDNITYTAVTNTAIAGTLILEFNRLSDLTGDETYRQIAYRSESNLINPSPTPIYPNLVGGMLDLNTGKFFAYDAGWQSGIDSFYEYLIKSAIYDSAASTALLYQNFWITAVESTQRHLVSHPYNHPELTFITQLNASGSPTYSQDDYACFAGGNLLLGGAYLNRTDFIDLGLAHTDSCHRTYNATKSGMNPITFAWSPNSPIDNSGIGFNVISPINTLFPEPIESLFYAWRITGDTIWQDHVWSIFQAMQTDGNRDPDTLPTMACFWDVTKPLGGDLWDMLPSYYFAETLKYMYLTFSDPSLVSLDEFVFNTEGHPLRVQGEHCGGLRPERRHGDL